MCGVFSGERSYSTNGTSLDLGDEEWEIEMTMYGGEIQCQEVQG